jgi:hypothetical protein
MKKEIQLPPLRKPVLSSLPATDAAFVLTGGKSVAQKPKRNASRVKRYVYGVHLRYDEETKVALDWLVAESGNGIAALFRTLVRQEYKRAKKDSV